LKDAILSVSGPVAAPDRPRDAMATTATIAQIEAMLRELILLMKSVLPHPWVLSHRRYETIGAFAL
jgi:hypothetical protein